jgi:ribose/xylose/arabinose/galactoside ABC-type transport system permease subunit
VIALAVNMVVLAGDIDISVGAGLALSAMTAGVIGVHTDSFFLAFAGALGVGLAIGTVNAILVTLGRIPSIIVTLGMLYALRGLVLETQKTGVTQIPSSVRVLGEGKVLGLSVNIIVLIVVFIAFELIARHTTWGRNIFAVGGNRHAARLAGIKIDLTRAVAFIGVGVCLAIAAMMYVGQLGLVQPQAATGLELEVVAAVVIGGTSITGGRGSTFAPIVGAVLLGTILNGLNLLGVEEQWQFVFTGGLILLAVASDVGRRRLVRRLEAR